VVFQEDVVLVGEELIADVCDSGAENHCEEQASEVYKTAVSEDSAVGMEDAEGDGVGDEQYAEVSEDGPEVDCDFVSAFEEVVCKVAAEDDDEVVYEQDAPVGQCVTAEVPIRYA
jgi:hypothetical protein